MAFHRDEKTGNFTVMSNHHLRSRTLSLKAKGLMSQILSYPDDWKFSIAGLAAMSRESKAGIGSALDELERNGYIRRTRKYCAHRFAGVEYDIYETPPAEKQPAETTPAEASYPEFPYPQMTDTGSRSLLNTNILRPDAAQTQRPIHAAATTQPEKLTDEEYMLLMEDIIRRKRQAEYPKPPAVEYEELF